MSAAPLRADRSPAAVAAAQAQPRPSRPALSIAPMQERAKSMAPFAWLWVGIVVAALGSVLVLNTTMSEGAYDAQQTKIEIAQLHQERANLLIALEANAAPGALAARAAALGMVPAPEVGFVSLTEARVLKDAGAQ